MMKLRILAALSAMAIASCAIGAPPNPAYVSGTPSSGMAKFVSSRTVGQATAGTDYAAPTSGSSILYGNGSGGFSNVTIGSGISFSGGTLTATGAGGTVTASGSPTGGFLAKWTSGTDITKGDLSGDCTTSGTLVITCTKTSSASFTYFATGTDAANLTGTVALARLTSGEKMRTFGTTFGDTAGSALTSGSVVYFTVPYACTISAWNIAVDAGTVTLDVWKIATGTAIPTISNTITASAKPALSSNTALHSTSMSGWTTSVTADDIFAIKLDTVATAKFVSFTLECGL